MLQRGSTVVLCDGVVIWPPAEASEQMPRYSEYQFDLYFGWLCMSVVYHPLGAIFKALLRLFDSMMCSAFTVESYHKKIMEIKGNLSAGLCSVGTQKPCIAPPTNLPASFVRLLLGHALDQCTTCTTNYDTSLLFFSRLLCAMSDHDSTKHVDFVYLLSHQKELDAVIRIALQPGFLETEASDTLYCCMRHFVTKDVKLLQLWVEAVSHVEDPGTRTCVRVMTDCCVYHVSFVCSEMQKMVTDRATLKMIKFLHCLACAICSSAFSADNVGVMLSALRPSLLNVFVCSLSHGHSSVSRRVIEIVEALMAKRNAHEITTFIDDALHCTAERMDSALQTLLHTYNPRCVMRAFSSLVSTLPYRNMSWRSATNLLTIALEALRTVQCTDVLPPDVIRPITFALSQGRVDIADAIADGMAPGQSRHLPDTGPSGSILALGLLQRWSSVAHEFDVTGMVMSLIQSGVIAEVATHSANIVQDGNNNFANMCDILKGQFTNLLRAIKTPPAYNPITKKWVVEFDAV